MQCPRCGYILGPFDSACPRCAAADRTQAVVPPSQAGYKVCARCGQRAVPAMPACGRCGLPFGTGPYVEGGAHPMPVVRSAGRRNRTLVVLPVLLALAVVLAVVGVRAGSPRARAGGWRGIELLGKPQNLLGAAPIDDAQISRRLMQAGATTGGEVEVSLAWNSTSDFDLEVRDPSGELIWARHRESASGGIQDVDANPTVVQEGAGGILGDRDPTPDQVAPLPDSFFDLSDQIEGLGARGFQMPSSYDGKPPSLFSRHPVEQIYFARAPKGVYTVYAHCYWWRERNQVPVPYVVQVRSRGRTFHQACGLLGPACYVADRRVQPVLVCQFQVR